jgi:hypothetical protein
MQGRARRLQKVLVATFTLLSIVGWGAYNAAYAASTYVKIVSPVGGATVFGTVTIATNESKNVASITVYVDNIRVGSSAPGAPQPYSVPWDSTKVSDGSHSLSVKGFNRNSAVIAGDQINVLVRNQSSVPTPTATPSPAVSATPTISATPTVAATPTLTPSAEPTPSPSSTLSVTATATDTPMPTETATPSATPTASPMPTVAATPTLTPTLTPSPTPTPAGSIYYVSPTGNDSNAGSTEAPWRTIQHAANLLLPGQQAIIASGTYPERVTLSSSGTSDLPIVLRVASGAEVRVLGFVVSGSYWTINGFDISTQTNGTDGYGIYLTGNASYDIAQGNYVHELCREGIYMDPWVSHIAVTGNRIWGAEMSGITIDGIFDTVENNEIWDTQQAPRKLGGIYKGCVTPSGSDADAIRFFGQHHEIRSNYLHDIRSGTVANPNPHTDCFQTWGSNVRSVDDILIDRNWCRWPAASNSIDNEASMIEGVDGAVGCIMYQNNVFSDMRQGINVGTGVSATMVRNNTWDHILQEAVIFTDTRSQTDEIVNNIFYDVGQGGDSYACIPAGSPVIAANDFVMRNGSPGSYCSSAPYISVDPMFQYSGDSSGLGADYHLQSISPLSDNGVTLSDIPSDYDGTARPLGAGYSIGAFEK